MTLTVDLWNLLSGAVIGVAVALMPAGRYRVAKAAVLGAIVAVLLVFLRGLI
ncbi:hypothetical protein AB1M95_11705 [Sulfitobacter sp. LCG007]